MMLKVFCINKLLIYFCLVYVTIPGPPTNVHATEINKTYIVLSWTPPSPRGRAPVWYLIEKCEGDSHVWQRVNTAVQLRSPRYPVFDMDDKKTYRFRIITVNKYGSSEPSEPTAPIQKVDPYGKKALPVKLKLNRPAVVVV